MAAQTEGAREQLSAIPFIGNAVRRFAAPAIVRASSYWTPKRMAKEASSKGKKSGQTAGTWVDSLAACRRVICLSPEEARKFALPKGRSMAERHGYVAKRSMPFARSWCDATNTFHPNCMVFFPKELA